MSNPEDCPLLRSRMNYDRYSTDQTKFSVGFASALGQLLSCNHIYNQFIFLEDPQKTIRQLESKRLRLQSLSAYSRENSIARDATNDFLNEASAISGSGKGAFQYLAWTDERTRERYQKPGFISPVPDGCGTEARTDGAPQIYWAGIPGNEADFPMNDSFDTFAEQASCFLNLETNYRPLKPARYSSG